MKRDPDIIRKILFFLEENMNTDTTLPSHEININNIRHEVILYHLLLLEDVGFIECSDMSSARGSERWVKRLTWEGHEFIEAARNDTNWNKAKERMAQAGGFVLELAKPLLLDIIKGGLGLNSG